MDEITNVGRALLGVGLESKDIGVMQMAFRAVVVYVVTLAVVRVGKKRFMGRATAFDVILGIILGSTVSRVLTGNTPLLPGLGAAAVLVALHWVFSAIAMGSQGFGWLVKGQADVLIRGGQVDGSALRKAHMTQQDLAADLRGNGISDPKEVAEARLERSGSLSVIEAKPEGGGKEPRVVYLDVREGVQRIRIEIEA
jgi:uncharacterized membrane protein YcaP (DUF421 family)